MGACSRGLAEVVTYFIENGANVNAIDSKGRTPLMKAAYYGSHKTCQLLIEAGADMLAQDHFGLTALHLAAIRGQVDCCDILANDSTLSIKDNNGQTAINHTNEPLPVIDRKKSARTKQMLNFHMSRWSWHMFCLGRHPRLGKDSLIQLLNDDILELIYRNVQAQKPV
eukprot:c8731_g1_i5.p1 GENE.c8731_g1_i5~~c8731_g1_i5.p1  ORF type:complete len:168 (-),score=30.71 c8731_g1_i5:415-918(-)